MLMTIPKQRSKYGGPHNRVMQYRLWFSIHRIQRIDVRCLLQLLAEFPAACRICSLKNAKIEKIENRWWITVIVKDWICGPDLPVYLANTTSEMAYETIQRITFIIFILYRGYRINHIFFFRFDVISTSTTEWYDIAVNRAKCFTIFCSVTVEKE